MEVRTSYALYGGPHTVLYTLTAVMHVRMHMVCIWQWSFQTSIGQWITARDRSAATRRYQSSAGFVRV